MRRRKSKIAPETQGRLIACFVEGHSARSVAGAIPPVLDTVTSYFKEIREKLATEMDSRFERLELGWPDGVTRNLDVSGFKTTDIVGAEGETPMFGVKMTKEGVFTVGLQEGAQQEIWQSISKINTQELILLRNKKNRSNSEVRRQKIDSKIKNIENKIHHKCHFKNGMIFANSLDCYTDYFGIRFFDKNQYSINIFEELVLEYFLRFARDRVSKRRGIKKIAFFSTLKECEYLFNSINFKYTEMFKLMEVEEYFNARRPDYPSASDIEDLNSQISGRTTSRKSKRRRVPNSATNVYLRRLRKMLDSEEVASVRSEYPDFFGLLARR